MKKLLFIIFISFIFQNYVISQEDPVNWEVSRTNNSDNSITLNINADINKEWYIYGINIKEGGPLPLIIEVENPDDIISSSIEELSKSDITYDEIFEMNVSSYSGIANFRYNFIPKPETKKLNLIIDGQACNKVNGSCTQVYKNIPIEIN